MRNVSAGGSSLCRIGTCGSRWGTWMVERSFSHSSRPRRSHVRTYIEYIKTDTILHAIRPPPFNLHSYPVDIIKLVKLTVFAGRIRGFVVPELAVVGGVRVSLDVRSVSQVANNDGLFVPILKTNADTILHAIRPPPSNLHS